MRDYRAYILGIDGHRFMWVENFLSAHPDDAAALSAAKQITDKHDVEVWDCGRLVAQLSPSGEVISPGLVPSLVFATAPDTEGNSVEPTVAPISLGMVSKLVSAASSG
jgi:hypothetical protein